MSDPIQYLSANSSGVWTLIGLLVAVMGLIHWATWLTGRGRFRDDLRPDADNRALRYVFSEATVKIIDDFRHLLALVLVLIFAAALTYAMVASGSGDEMRESVQVIAASLGGLVGSIIGYYFGESSAVAGLPAGAGAAGGATVDGGGSDPTDPPVQSPPPPLSDEEAEDEVMGLEADLDEGEEPPPDLPPDAEPPIPRAPTPRIL